jgi:cold shock CspA family protein
VIFANLAGRTDEGFRCALSGGGVGKGLLHGLRHLAAAALTKKGKFTAMLEGRIKAWNSRGFGFIARADGEPDVFVHCSALIDGRRDSLPIGEAVAFELDPKASPSKPRASKVAVLHPRPSQFEYKRTAP